MAHACMDHVIRSPQGVMWKTVSEDCNLACDYCYYSSCQGKPGSTIRRIDIKVLETFVQKYMAVASGAASFAWQGGEPLLAGKDFFERVVALQAMYAPPHTVISNSVQTNGTLIDEEWAAFFRRYSFLLGVSLDGPQAIHDKRRVTGSGAGSYKAVMRGIDYLRQDGVDFNILTVVHEDNVHEAAALMQFYAEQQFTHVQFIPCMDFRSQDVDAPGRFVITPEQYGQFLCEAFDIWYNEGNPLFSVRMFDNVLQVEVGMEPEMCIHRSSCPQTLILEQNGDAYPCDFFIHERYKLGNVATDELQHILNHPGWKQFLQMKQDMPAACRQCEYERFCHGGCPRNRIGQGWEINEHTDYFCASYRMLYAYAAEQIRHLGRVIRTRELVRYQSAGGKLPGRNEPCLCGSGRKFKQCCATLLS
ncbi:anaerobic sulfatase maturase [Paenibacillus sp. MER TA 81-3]|nr:anaerobic sulfatase maturase [Paenibacillus sp. MER TA 81-3]